MVDSQALIWFTISTLAEIHRNVSTETRFYLAHNTDSKFLFKCSQLKISVFLNTCSMTSQVQGHKQVYLTNLDFVSHPT